MRAELSRFEVRFIVLKVVFCRGRAIWCQSVDDLVEVMVIGYQSRLE